MEPSEIWKVLKKDKNKKLKVVDALNMVMARNPGWVKSIVKEVGNRPNIKKLIKKEMEGELEFIDSEDSSLFIHIYNTLNKTLGKDGSKPFQFFDKKITLIEFYDWLYTNDSKFLIENKEVYDKSSKNLLQAMENVMDKFAALKPQSKDQTSKQTSNQKNKAPKKRGKRPSKIKGAVQDVALEIYENSPGLTFKELARKKEVLEILVPNYPSYNELKGCTPEKYKIICKKTLKTVAEWISEIINLKTN